MDREPPKAEAPPLAEAEAHLQCGQCAPQGEVDPRISSTNANESLHGAHHRASKGTTHASVEARHGAIVEQQKKVLELLCETLLCKT